MHRTDDRKCPSGVVWNADNVGYISSSVLTLSKLCKILVISLHSVRYNCVLLAKSYILSHIIISEKRNEIINYYDDDDD